MASRAPIVPVPPKLEIPVDLRELLHIQETPMHYAVRTLSGSIRIHPKASTHYTWQLLEGIMDDGKSTSDERKLERERELARDEVMFGTE